MVGCGCDGMGLWALLMDAGRGRSAEPACSQSSLGSP